jgi:5-methylcytosine-specific restriction endonuclease McrBC regulatory subunit McrC
MKDHYQKEIAELLLQVEIETLDFVYQFLKKKVNQTQEAKKTTSSKEHRPSA